MKQEYEALFTPWKIGNVEIKKPHCAVLHGRNLHLRLDGAQPF